MIKQRIHTLAGFVCFALVLFFGIALRVDAAGKTVYFGAYPQTKATLNWDFQTELNRQKPDSRGFVTYQGVTYCSGNEGYYLVEPISWRVIGTQGSSLILMSENILENRPYNGQKWSDSEIRGWLNGEFYEKAFSAGEKSDILSTTLTSEVKPYPYGGEEPYMETTTDKVYLLDETEAMSTLYGFSGADGEDPLRIAYITDFVNGRHSETPKTGRWYLRAAARWNYGNVQASQVNEQGAIIGHYPTYDRGIRPVIRVSSSSKLVSETKPGTTGTTPEPTPKPTAKITYKITLKGNGGTPSSKKYSVTYNQKYGSLPKPKRSGYVFKGWYTKKSGGKKVQAGTLVTSKKTHTLYAQWTKRKSIAKAKVTVKSCTYNGKARKPQVTVTYNKKKLKQGTDYKVTYSNNVNASSSAKAKITGTGNYTGTVKASFTIKKAEQEIQYVKKITTLYTGSAKEFDLNVKVKGKAKVSYKSGNKSVATVSANGKVKVKGTGETKITITVAATKNYKSATRKADVVAQKTDAPVQKVKKKIINKSTSIPMSYVFNANTICKNKIPQGICATNRYLLVSMYEDGKESVIVVLDRNNYSAKAVLIMDYQAHLGGIAFDGQNIWVAGKGKQVVKLSVSKLEEIVTKVHSQKNNTYKLQENQDYAAFSTKKTPSFLTYNKWDGCLYVGTFSGENYSVLQAYTYDASANKLHSGSSYEIPDRIQGAVFYGAESLYLSQSYGRMTVSNLLAGTLSKGKFSIKKCFELKDASLAEGLEIIGNKLYVLFESSAKKYHLISSLSGKCQDDIWTINLNKLR